MYTLYFAPGAASMAVHHALLEIGAAHELKELDLAAGAQRSPEYLRLNPNGVVPTLVIDGRPFYESAALLMLLADRHPEAGLAPAAGTPEKSLWYQWIMHLANTVQPAFRLWFYPHELCGDALAPTIKDAARQRIEAAWERIDAHLAANGPYMTGGKFSAVDIFCTMLMRWSRNMPKPATAWPHLEALAESVRARPAWKQLNEIEGLTEWL